MAREANDKLIMTDTDVVIAGGGLAGLVCALELARAGHQVTLVERKTYPFHRVCGEYVSNEVRPYLASLGVDLAALGAVSIDEFVVSAPSGRQLTAPLDLGGFGISRYQLDFTLYQLAQQAGVIVLTGLAVDSVLFVNEQFSVTLSDGQVLHCRQVIGAFGKRSRLDKTLHRSFIRHPSPYVGVKYHVQVDLPRNQIALHNFADGYCGMSAIEDGKYCICYLTTRQNLRQHGSIPAMEQAVLYRNPQLRAVLSDATYLYTKPEVINEISFAPKQAVDNHILMVGDSAGLITPLCGNGMAMAIHGARLASQLTHRFLTNELARQALETTYRRDWSVRFGRRLWVGRTVQKLFGSPLVSELALSAFSLARPALRHVMQQTHGAVMDV